MIELYLIFIPAIFALLIFFCRKSLLIRSLLVGAGFCHLAGIVYLLGTGSVMLCGTDYAESVFKSAATSATGEGGADTHETTKLSLA